MCQCWWQPASHRQLSHPFGGSEIESFKCGADLGMGVNAGLVDVAVLFEVLDEFGNDLPAALQEYERLRLPEHAALIDILQVRTACSAVAVTCEL